jgi:predicted RecB family endonuclease
MKNILENVGANLHNLVRFQFNKVQILFFLMLFFSLLYMLLDDKHFEGVNKFKEIVKEEVIKDKVKKEITENYANLDSKETIEIDKSLDKYYTKNKVIEEKVIDEATKETEIETTKEELDPTKVKPTLFTKYLNRLYFAIVTGCLLGYGDIFPVSNISKTLAALQGLLTVSLIIY